MQMRKASRKAVKIKINIGGPAGSGKTKSALRLAHGICGDWEKICVLDAENGSAELYEDMGSFWVIPINNFSPETYIEAINTCVKNNIEVIVIDGISPEWEYLLELQTKITEASQSKNSYTAWSKVTPLHNKFKNVILQAPVHIITTVRQKQEYSLNNNGDGKTSVVKLGMAPITRNDWDYEVTLNFDVNQSHFATVNKDRTGLFVEEPPFVITEETGEKIKEWCNSSAADAEVEFNNATIEVNNASSREELGLVYTKYISLKDNEEFIKICSIKKSSFQ